MLLVPGRKKVREFTNKLYGPSYWRQINGPADDARRQTKHSDAFSIAGDKDTAKILRCRSPRITQLPDAITIPSLDGQGCASKFTAGTKCYLHGLNGAAVFADPNGGIVTTDKDGLPALTLPVTRR